MVSKKNDDGVVIPDVVRAFPVDRVRDDVDEETWERVFWCWSTAGGMRPALALRFYRREFGEDAPAPSVDALRMHAKRHGWAARRDEQWRRTGGLRLHEMQHTAFTVVEQSFRDILAVQAGAFDDDEQPLMTGALHMKAADLALRAAERVPSLMPMMPKIEHEEIDLTGLTDEQAEAAIREQYQRRKGKSTA